MSALSFCNKCGSKETAEPKCWTNSPRFASIQFGIAGALVGIISKANEIIAMNKLQSKIKTFLSAEAGTTSVEYAVMLFLVIGACIAAITSVGGENGIIWDDNAAEITTALQ